MPRTDNHPADDDNLCDAVVHLTEEVSGLAGQVEVLRIAVDDLRQEVEWALRNIQRPAWAPVQPAVSGASNPAPITKKPEVVTTTASLPPEKRPEQNQIEGRGTSATCAVEQKKPNDIERPQKVPTPRRSKKPLYLRMYAYPQMTALIQFIGYAGKPVEQAQQEMESLKQRYVAEKVEEAAAEITWIDDAVNPPMVHLTDYVRRYAAQLLGMPPETGHRKPSTAVSPAPAAASAEKASENGKLVKQPRNYVLGKFMEWAESTQQQCSDPSYFRTKHPDVDAFRVVDYVLRRDNRYVLVAVRPHFRSTQERDLLVCKDLLGDEFKAARIWPIDGATGWQWQEYPVEAADSESVSEATTRHKS